MNPQPIPFQSLADLTSAPFRPMVLPQVPHFQMFAQVLLPHPLCFHAFVQLKGGGGTPLSNRGKGTVQFFLRSSLATGHWPLATSTQRHARSFVGRVGTTRE